MAEPETPATEKPQSSVAKNAAITFAGTLASRVLGMLRETLIAATFPTAITDVFFVAWRVPNALRALLAEGAASAALGPAFSHALEPEKGQSEKNIPRLREVLSRVGGAAFVALALATALGVIFARPIFQLVSHGFNGDTARFELGVTLLRVLFPFLFLMGWFSLGRTALERLGDFTTGSKASVLQNVAFVLAPFLLVPIAPYVGVSPIVMMAVAALIGGLLQVLYLRPALRRRGVLVRPTLANDPALSDVSKTFVTMLYGQLVYQATVMLSARLLATLEPGSASWNSYAQRLADIPQGLFTVSLAGAAAAEMEKAAVKLDRDAVARTYERTLSLSAFVAIPACVLLAVYADAIVPLVFGYGRFARGENAARNMYEVARSLHWQAIGVGLFAFVHPTNRVFSAFKRRKPILTASTIALVSYAFAGVWLARVRGHVGVAMAGAISAAVQLVVLLWLVRKEIPFRPANVGESLAKVLGATGVTALAAVAAVRWLPIATNTILSKALAVIVGGALLVVYALAAWWLRCEEATEIVRRLRRRRRPPEP
ncbi:MAG: murein biosynthesis integral membrane protein MurJ [Polyangiales bacterium]